MSDVTNGQAGESAPVEGEVAQSVAEAVTAEATQATEKDTTESAGEGQPESGEPESDLEQPRRSRSGLERLRRQNEALRAEVETLRSRPAMDDSEVIERLVAKEVGEVPKESDYSDYAAYDRALTAYELDKRQVTRDVRSRLNQSNDAVSRHRQEVESIFAERLIEAETAIPDYKDVIRKAASAELSPHVTELLMESEKAGAVLYHIAKNPGLREELNGLSPLKAAARFGAIESRLSLPSPKGTTAPPPVRPLKGAATPDPDPEKMSMSEYKAWRQSQG